MASALKDWDIKGKVCLITGANSGIGRETAFELVKLGAGRVILACRNLEAGEAAIKYIRHEAGIADEQEAERRLALRKLDLSSLASIRQFAKHINDEEKQLHVLINNAGVYAPGNKAFTEDGFELSFGTNHLGHFLLTKLLLDLLKRSAPSRIVVVSSMAYLCCLPFGFHIENANYEQGWYEAWIAYSHSKLANILFARILDRKLNGNGPSSSGVSVFSLHPGVIKTNLLQHRHWLVKMLVDPVSGYLFKTPQQGAATTLYCATQPGIEQQSGKFFSGCAVSNAWSIAKDDIIGEKLWQLSEKLVDK